MALLSTEPISLTISPLERKSGIMPSRASTAAMTASLSPKIIVDWLRKTTLMPEETHWVDAGIAEDDGLSLGFVSWPSLRGVELSLSDANCSGSLISIAEGGEGEDVGVLVDLEAGTLESNFEALEFGRQNAVFEFHCRVGVLHGAIVDNYKLLDVVGDGRLGIAGELGGRGERGGEDGRTGKGRGEETLFESDS